MTPSHFIGLSIHDPVIRQNFEDLQGIVKKDKSYNVADWMWLATPQLHITFSMVHLDDPDVLQHAIDVLRAIEPQIQTEILGTEDGDTIPLNLTLKGIHAGFSEADIKACRIAHCDIEKDKNFDLLVQIAHLIISSFLEYGVYAKKDLKNITYDAERKMYVPD